MLLKNLVILVPASIGILAGLVSASRSCPSADKGFWYVLVEYSTSNLKWLTITSVDTLGGVLTPGYIDVTEHGGKTSVIALYVSNSIARGTSHVTDHDHDGYRTACRPEFRIRVVEQASLPVRDLDHMGVVDNVPPFAARYFFSKYATEIRGKFWRGLE